ncbi:MAG: proline--tRNA ligase [Deltaproteobacteria bacterium]|nr:proline--tRNA ligase [Deltaproteobacteria bacterium]NND30400.1 proline--tRNA ligase [Myxococcales bacterium]MBT8464988.1 proline--tRNA ligase [Deltaproteobacteria bacterium]MBT8480803.1 proline--tRNA ligase [Deltaproteobacteria bacterium]NNK09643.1 proline--tRNA ligase [Myxococcales bacterium]
MRYSRAFIPTLKEAPKDATMPSHVLMLRAGYARMVGAGIYELLPLGTRVLHRIERIIREEMDAAGAQELLMPTFVPGDYFKETGRWDLYGPTLLRIEDRKGGEYHLAPTHEEIVTDLARREVKSYRQLPLNLYQIQLKYRDEPRPRGGLLRCREFIMKDAYSFDVSEEAAVQSYEQMRDTYHRIFTRLGLEYRVVEADSGAIGGKQSAEFQVLAQTGEDWIVACSSCDYAANVEVAKAGLAAPPASSAAEPQPLEKVETPETRSIEEVVSFFGGETNAAHTLKSLLYVAGEEVCLAVVRGDHEVNELGLARHLGVEEVVLASDAAVKEATGTEIGFVGPVGFSGRILADPDAVAVRNAIAGATETPYHYKNVNHGRDFKAEVVPIRQAASGDPCPSCDGTLELYRGIEGGHIFVLGTHYSDKMQATFLDEEGSSHSIVMGCYGIGVSRLIAAIIEQHHDEDGIRWPIHVAPFQVIITPIGKDEAPLAKATEIYEALRAQGVDALLDDRSERPGVKFKDADLLGIPLRITVGSRGLKQGTVELKERTQNESRDVPMDDAADAVRDAMAALQS